MALKVPNQGELAILAQLLTYFNMLTIRLFQNNYTPTDTDTEANFTQATFTGYASQSIATFGPAFINGSGKAETNSTLKTFTQTGTGVTNDIYGYYVVTSGGVLVWAERDPAGPVAMNATGKQYAVFPRFTLKTEF